MSFSQPVAPSDNSTQNPSASVLRARLITIDTERTDVHAQTAQLRARLIELAKARKAVAEQLKTVTYPILNIPPEVTSQIFAYSVEIMGDTSQHSAPWVLTHVCRAWRRLALALPRIWSRIRMGNRSSLHIDMMLRLWFQRAGSSPLQVLAPTKNAQRLYSLITISSDQLESLSCQIPLPPACSLDGIAGRLPQLRKLTLSIGKREGGPVTLFSQAPALRQVELIYANGDSSVPAQIDLPWAQLTDVCFSNNHPVLTILQTLEKMPQLESLALPAIEYPPPAATIQLPRLRILTCRNNSRLGTTPSLRLLASLKCPALEVLEIRVPIGRHRNFLCDFLDGILCAFLNEPTRLRSLSLFQSSGIEAIEVLRHAAAIESLTLEEMTRPSMLFNAMVDDHQLLPHLAELTIQTAAIEFPAYPSMLSMLRARCDANVQPAFGALLRRFTYKTPEIPQASFSKATISQQDFDESLRRDIVRQFGCKVRITAPRLSKKDSDVGSGSGGSLLYSLDEVDDDV
ncbi:hypothetical protein C8F01DRAFT_1147276 [Mycena amicta]|nr:hypothetical protein C8F01DRAFT_1147276 [Mycena amicta]